MRVLHLLKTSTGASWALRQIRELVRLGVDVHVAAPSGGALLQHYRAAGAVVHEVQTDLPIRRPWKWPGVRDDLRMLVRNTKPDIIHSHFVGTTIAARLALGKAHPIPRIFQVPGPLHLEHRFFRGMEMMTAGTADFWIGSCVWTCRTYARYGVPRRRLSLAYYGVDLEEFAPSRLGTLRALLGLHESTRIVGMVAYMYAPKRYLGQTRGLKGHEDLIDAVQLRAAAGDDVVCVMVGGPWANAHRYAERVRAYAQQRCADRVKFLGTRRDVPALYADMDVVVHPSHSENVGGAAESLLLSVPTIASNVGGLPDLVRHGDTGWLVPPRDAEALSAAIGEALGDPTEARRRACRGQILARELFDVRATAAAVMNCYMELLRNGELPEGQIGW